jgi:hypothetical protein
MKIRQQEYLQNSLLISGGVEDTLNAADDEER